ncbi:hypothetical protein ABK040_016795 [Willaertia magna]
MNKTTTITQLNEQLKQLCFHQQQSEDQILKFINQNFPEYNKNNLPSSTIHILTKYFASKRNVNKIKELLKNSNNFSEEIFKKQILKNNLNLTITNKSPLSEIETFIVKNHYDDYIAYTHSIVIEAFIIRGNMKQAELYFEGIKYFNADVLNVMIDGWLRNYDKNSFDILKEKINYYFKLFDLFKIYRNITTYRYYLKFKYLEMEKINNILPIQQTLEMMIKKDKIQPDSLFISIFTSKIMKIKNNNLLIKKLYILFKKYLMNNKNITELQYLSILSSLTINNCIHESIELFDIIKNLFNQNTLQKDTLQNKQDNLKLAYHLMIKMFILANDEEATFVLYQEMLQKKIKRNYYLIISTYFHMKNYKKVIQYYHHRLKDNSIKEDENIHYEIIGYLIESYGELKQKERVLETVRKAKEENLLNDKNCIRFIKALGKVDEMNEAEEIFKLFSNNNNSSSLDIYNVMLHTYCCGLYIEKALTFYLSYPMKGNLETYEILLNALTIVKEYNAIMDNHRIMINLNILPTHSYYTKLIDVLLQDKQNEKTRTFLQQLPKELERLEIENADKLLIKLLF